MKTPVLIATAAVLGIAIGFTVGRGGGPHEAAQTNEAEATTRNSPASRSSADRKAGSGSESVLAGVLKGREIGQLSAEEALKLLEPRIAMDWTGDPLETARNNYELQLLLNKLPASVLEQVIELSRKSNMPPFRVQQLFGALAMRDWQKAAAWAARQPDAALWKAATISRLANSDPGRAAELYQEAMMNGTAGRSFTWESGYNIANAYAKQGLQPLLAFLDTLPSGDVSNLMSNAARSLPKSELPAYLQEITNRVANGTVENWAINNLISNISNSNPEEVRKWIESQQPGEQRSKLELTLAASLARQGRSEETLALLKSAMAGAPGKEKELITDQLGSLIQTSPNIALQLAEALPPGAELTKEDVKRFGNYGRCDVMVDLAKMIKSPEEQLSYLQDSLKNLGNRGKLNEVDFQLLSHRLDSLSLTGEAASAVQEALTNARAKALGGK